jgi:glycosyltransferase involved in cell wall biosynthesis
MRIGIEAERANNRVKTGVEHYAKELILQFAQMMTSDEFILYLRTEPEEWIQQLPKNFTYKVMPFPIFWTQLRVSWEMLWHRPDVLFIPASTMPLIHPAKTVVTVHDEAFMFYPDTYTPFQRYFHMFCDVLVSQTAWRIIAVSEATKKDFMRLWKVGENRIRVIHHGYTPQSTPPVIPAPEPESRRDNLDAGSKPGMTLQSGTQLPEKFVLFLSTIQPRKNLEGLIEAFRLFKKDHPEDPHKLVVAGRVGWKAEKTLEMIERNKDVVVYLNHVSDADRTVLYQKASALAVPSFYEGFGMWILEAFDAGIPVITSNISSMPEVAGDAAEYCDPHDIRSIEKAMAAVLLNPSRAEDLVRLGTERLKEFGWQKCARATLDALTER